jgi:hypothetical protein
MEIKKISQFNAIFAECGIAKTVFVQEKDIILEQNKVIRNAFLFATNAMINFLSLTLNHVLLSIIRGLSRIRLYWKK